MVLEITYQLFQRFLDSLFPPRSDFRALKELIESPISPEQQDDYLESLLTYKDSTVRKAIWVLKYRGDNRVASLFASLLHDHIVEKVSEKALFYNFQTPLLIPLPISKERRKERGWNQTELIALCLKKLNREQHFIIALDVLFKIKHTTPQTKLSRSERLINLKDCFMVSENKKNFIKNRTIILIDDVMTTGSTINEARQTLLKAGVRDVMAFTVAH